MSCSQRCNLLELINADCAWYFVNTLFQPLLNDPKCTNDNVYCLCSCFLHSGNFNFQVFTFRDFIDYLKTWSLTVQMERSLDGVYTRMLRMVLNVSWEDHTKNVDLYGALPRVTDKIRARRMGLAGHCVRHPELVASNLILWEPKHGTRSRGRPATTYIDTLRRDTGLSNTGEIRALMINSDLWRAAIRDSRVGVG